MTSKKNKGNDPEALRAIERDVRNTLGSNTVGTGEGRLTLRNDEVAYLAGRRAMAYELLQSGGLAEAKLGTEILFLLPDSFVEFYGSLFHQALRVGDSSVMHGRSGGLEKAKGQTGMALGSDTQLQAQGSGKKYKNTPMAIGSERALKVKERIDQGLRELVLDAKRSMSRSRMDNTSGGSGNFAGQKQCRGAYMIPAGLPGSGEAKKCRRFLKDDWDFCPTCGTRVE